MTSLWSTREQATASLAQDHQDLLEVMNDLFALVDDSAQALHGTDSPFARVTSLCLAKARHLALGCYSLCLDSLAQEAGALFRPLIEAIELLRYFRLDPSRVDEALENRLPKAGVIAKRVDGHYQDMRDYLNAHASHLSVGPESMWHLLATNSDEGLTLRLEQPFRSRVLLTNMQTLFAALWMVAAEGVQCAAVAGCPGHAQLAQRTDGLRNQGLQAFKSALGDKQA